MKLVERKLMQLLSRIRRMATKRQMIKTSIKISSKMQMRGFR